MVNLLACVTILILEMMVELTPHVLLLGVSLGVTWF
jgi:hypothetical protein